MAETNDAHFAPRTPEPRQKVFDTAVATFDWGALTKQELHRAATTAVARAWTYVAANVHLATRRELIADMLVDLPNGRQLAVHVWASRRGGCGFSYAFAPKRKMSLEQQRYVARVHAEQGLALRLYLIPTLAWLEPDGLLKDRDYEGHRSEPEWGLNTTDRQLPSLERFAWDIQMRQLRLR